MLKRGIAWSLDRFLGVRIVRTARKGFDPLIDGERAELLALRSKSDRDDRTLQRLQDIVNEYGFGPNRNRPCREMMSQISREWHEAKGQ